MSLKPLTDVNYEISANRGTSGIESNWKNVALFVQSKATHKTSLAKVPDGGFPARHGRIQLFPSAD